ncbi:hypothetical protein K8I85_11645, partial [bacterium]|nr:hypothetical protein [bacterium]
MPARIRSASFAPSTRPLLLLPFLGILLASAVAGAAPLAYWLPTTVPADALDHARITLYYEGDAGRLLGAQADAADA